VKSDGNKFTMIPVTVSRLNLRGQLAECSKWGGFFKSAAIYCGWTAVALAGTYAAYKFWNVRKIR
jgi:hypothetical protein